LEEEEKLKSIRIEEEAWKYINKYRKEKEEKKEKRKIDEGMEMNRWNAHFMELLGRTKERVVLEEEKEKKKAENKRERSEEEKEEITSKTVK